MNDDRARACILMALEAAAYGDRMCRPPAVIGQRIESRLMAQGGSLQLARNESAYWGYSGRAADVASTTAHDPIRTFALMSSCMRQSHNFFRPGGPFEHLVGQ